jgi:tetratricopeptide (TPR) repeat protein
LPRTRRLVGCGVAVCSIVWVTSPAAALPPELQRQLDETFRQVMRNPGDTPANLAYAKQMEEAGEYEKAIASLERILIADPAQTWVRVEIGRLYFRLGSYEIARTYFQRALADSSLDPAQRAVAQQYLADIAERLSRHQFAGFASVGAGWESNANTGPDPVTLRALGTPLSRPTSQRPQSDFSFFGAGNVEHSYDLDTQNDAHIVSTLLGFGNAFTRFSHQDVVLGELTTGVRFKPAPATLGELQVRPHVIGNYILLDGDRYESTVGFGIDVTMEWSEQLVSELTLEYRRPEFGTIPRLLDNQNQTGDEKVVKLRTAYQLAPNQLLLADLVYRSASTKRTFYDFTQYQATLAYSYAYPAPAQLTPGAWSVRPYVSWYSRDYGGPDPTIDPISTRLDNQVRIGVSHSIPVADGWSVFQSVEHLWADSNIPNYTFQDTAVVVGLTRRF